MKKIRLLITYFIAIVCVMTYLFFPKNEKVVFSPHPTIVPRYLIYMMDKTQLVPVTITAELSEIEEEKILQLLQTMKQKLDFHELTPVFPQSLNCLSVKIIDDLVQVNFNEAFYTMNETYEMRCIEAIVSVITQIDARYQVEFLVNQNIVEEMPLSKMPMKPFDRTLGVNNFDLNAKDMHTTQSRLVVYRNDSNLDVKYSIVTKRISNQQDDRTFLNSVMKDTSMLLQIEKLEVQDRIMTLHLNPSFLKEEMLVDAKEIEPLLLTILMNDMADTFILKVNDETVSFNGTSDTRISLQDLNYNRIE